MLSITDTQHWTLEVRRSNGSLTVARVDALPQLQNDIEPSARASATATGAWALDLAYRYRLDGPLVEEVINMLLSLGKPTLLDVGAGTGGYVSSIRQHGIHASGIDGAAGIEGSSLGLVQQQVRNP